MQTKRKKRRRRGVGEGEDSSFTFLRGKNMTCFSFPEDLGVGSRHSEVEFFSLHIT